MSNAAPSTSLRLIRRKDIEQILLVSRSTIYARLDPQSKQHDPKFPKPIFFSVSPTSGVAWILSEIEDYIAHRIADSRKTAGV